MGISQSKNQDRSPSGRDGGSSGRRRAISHPLGQVAPPKTRPVATPSFDESTHPSLSHQHDEGQQLLPRTTSVNPRKSGHNRSRSTANPLSSHPPNKSSITAPLNPNSKAVKSTITSNSKSTDPDSKKKSKKKRKFSLSLSILPSRGPELEQARERERQRERWHGIDKEGAKLLGVGPLSEEERQRQAKRARRKQAEKDSAREKEWAEVCGRQRHKAAVWEQHRRLQSAERAALLREQNQQQEQVAAQSAIPPRRSTSRHDTVSRRKSHRPSSSSDQSGKYSTVGRGGSILTVMGVQPSLPDGSLTALPLFPPTPVNADDEDTSGERFWKKCVQAGLVADMPLHQREGGRESEHPLRWKWIHKKGESVSSVDEELGFV